MADYDFIGDIPSDIQSMRMNALKIHQAQQDLKNQNALRQVFMDPTSIDHATGAPTANALQRVMQIDPTTGMELYKSRTEIQNQQAEMAARSTDDAIKKLSFAQETLGPSVDIYQSAIDGGKSKEEATTLAQQSYTQGIDSLRKSGLYSADALSGFPTTYDPTTTPSHVQSVKDYLASQKEQREATHTAALDQHMEAVDSRGNFVPMEGGFSFDTRTNQWFRDGKATEAPNKVQKIGGASQDEFTPKMGGLMAAMAEQGVSLPTGFRSRAQQIELYQGLLDRNPDKSPDEIATLIKTGQIEFGAQKKETSSAAAIAGKVEVAANEIESDIPLIEEYAAKVPRSNFIPMNKLLQMPETALSDPNLRALKVAINSTLNSYDMLTARGGTDQAKRAEIRQLITSADGPEALQAAMAVMRKEAKIAHAAAVKATRVPELSQDDGGGGGTTQYHSFADIAAALTAKKITREQAETISRQAGFTQ